MPAPKQCDNARPHDAHSWETRQSYMASFLGPTTLGNYWECAGVENSPLSSVPDTDDLILEALLKVRETGNAGRAGPYVHRLPKDADRNWGWLQGQWGIVLAVDVVQQAYADQMSRLRELAERAHTYGPDEFGAFKRELHKILGELTD